MKTQKAQNDPFNISKPWKAQHTPGTWQYNIDQNSNIIYVRDNEYKIIAEIEPRPGHTEANASLIASAPELLGACEKSLDLIVAYATEKRVWEACELLKRTIAKAKGEV